MISNFDYVVKVLRLCSFAMMVSEIYNNAFWTGQSYKSQNSVKLKKKWLVCKKLDCFLIGNRLYQSTNVMKLQEIICKFYRIGSWTCLSLKKFVVKMHCLNFFLISAFFASFSLLTGNMSKMTSRLRLQFLRCFCKDGVLALFR